MELSRREFMGSGASTVTVLGFSLLRVPGIEALCDAPEPVAEIPVIWLATGACSGCSVSLLNSASPSIQELLLSEVLPGNHVSLAFHATVMAAAGDLAREAMEKVAREHRGKYLLVVDGATSMRDDGRYCMMGETDGQPVTGYQRVRDLGRDAMVVLAVGACASFGGIPAAAPNPTGSVSVEKVFEREGVTTPLVHLPGCPPHPDWIVGTIATLLLGGIEALGLDALRRPSPFFAQTVHDQCPYRGLYDRGEFADHFGEHGCLLKLGCKGPITEADCPIRKFNSGTNWCCEAGHPCIGCCHPDFPFEGSMFTPVQPVQLAFPGMYPPAQLPAGDGVGTDTYATIGMIGAGGFLAGVGIAAAAGKLKPSANVAGGATGPPSGGQRHE